MSKIITDEEYKKRVFSVLGKEYEVLEKYQHQNHKILVRHNECQREYRTNAGNLMLGHGCIECYRKNKMGKTRRVDIEGVVKYVESRGFNLVNHYYKDGRLYISIKHLKCGEISDKVYQNFKNQKTGCPNCADKERRISKSETSRLKFINEFNEMHGEDHTIVSEYVGKREKISIKHTVCGTIFEATPDFIVRKRVSKLCPTCGKNERSQVKSMTHEEFENKVYEKWGDEYKALSEYKRNFIKIKVLHTRCGNEYSVVPTSLLMGCGCPSCCSFDSKACKRIESFLIENKFYYIRELRIKGCRHKMSLPFDFAIMDKDKIKLLIEYDGEQHSVPVDFFGGEESLKSTRKRDDIKTKYCLKNNIKLLRIDYTEEENIEKILEKELL